MFNWRVCFSTFVALLISAALFIALHSETDCPFFECPTDDGYPQSCLDKVIPPWPICKFGSVDQFVEKAKDGASRCCGTDLSECKCPKKDTDKFLNEIGAWCDGVSTCDENHKQKYAESFVRVKDKVNHAFEVAGYAMTG